MLLANWADEIVMIDIRQAEEKDLVPAAALWQDRIAVLQQTDPLCRPTLDSRANWLACARRWLDDEESAIFVAAIDKDVVGYIVVALCGGIPGLQPKQVGKVVDMAVDLHCSHRGLSGSLLDQAQEWLRRRHIGVMTIDVPAFNPVEAAFWRARGGQQRFLQHWLVL